MIVFFILFICLSACSHEAAYQFGSQHALQTADQKLETVHFAISLQGRSKYPPQFTHFDYVNPAAPKGGIFHYAELGSFDNMVPWIASGHSKFNTDLVYDSLMVASADDYTVYPLVAQSAQWDDKHSFVTFNLNPKARWHDGSPLTSDDVVFTFELFRNHLKTNPNLRSFYAGIKSVHALTPHQVRFELEPRPSIDLIHSVASAKLLSRKYYQSHEYGLTSAEAPMGSGPYRVSKVDLGRQIRYERIQDYWAADLPSRRGFFNFDTVIVSFYRDVTAATVGFSGHQFDFFIDQDPRQLEQLATLPAVKDGRIALDQVKMKPPQTISGYYFNLRRAPFNNRHVREALTVLFDFEWINKNVLRDTYARAHGLFTGSEFEAKGLPSFDEIKLLKPFIEALPPRLFTGEFRASQTEGDGFMRPQLREAFRLFGLAGYHLENMKLVDTQGKQLSIEILADNRDIPESVHALYTYSLMRAGIDVQLRIVDSAQFLNRRRSFNFDIIEWPTFVRNPPGGEQNLIWSSAMANVPFSINTGGVSDPAVDALLEAADNAPSFAAKVTALRALDRVVSWNFYNLRIGWTRDLHFGYWKQFGRADEQREDIGKPVPEAWWSVSN